MASSPGEAAYEKWCECLNSPPLKRVKSLSLQPWGELTAKVKATWDAVAEAAIEQAKKGRTTP